MEPVPRFLRERILETVDRGASVAATARRFCLSETTIRNWLELRENGLLEPKPPSGGPEPSLNDEDRQRLLKAVDEHPDATLKQLKEICRLDVSESTLCRELQMLDRSRKRKVPRAAERNDERIQQQRAEWISVTEEIDPQRFVFLDQCGISTNMTKSYARAASGQRVFTDVPHRHYESLTVLGAVRLDGSDEMPTMAYPGGTTTERMLEYIHGPLGAVLRPGDIVVADNLAAHKSHRVASALAEHQATIWHLPSYSPDLNPIERLWGKIKDRLRAAKATTVASLQKALSAALHAITDQDIYNWFLHSNYLEPA